jgi:cytochrome c oxidase cbb3-type subunit II
MIKNWLLLVGIVGLFCFAMVGLTIVPKLIVEPNVEVADKYVPLQVEEGHKIYVREGCIYCHSQQVRPKGFGADEARGWGRASVATDYKGFNPHPLGTMRTGPDLSNIGSRQPSRDWHLQHLYNPRSVMKESIMPPFGWLFELVDEKANTDKASTKKGITVPKEYMIEGKKIVPKEEAEALVAYLLWLTQKEAKMPEPKPEVKN